MVFIILLLIITLSIASTAAFFSIWGLAEVFSGSFVAVAIMGTVLEAGKLMSASFLYRYWYSISVLMRVYLITAIVALMVITSAGIFGKLSYSYQQDIHVLTSINTDIDILTDQREELKALKEENISRKRQIDADIAGLPKDYVTGRQRLMESYRSETDSIQSNIASFNEQIRDKSLQLDELKKKALQEQLHVGPIIYIAKAFGRDTDDATKWLIFMIIFAFDPLAIILTIGTNIAFVEHKNLPRSTKADNSRVRNQNPTNDTNDDDTHELDDISERGIRAALEEFKNAMNNRELTTAELAQKAAFEEMLSKKALTTKMRNPTGS